MVCRCFQFVNHRLGIVSDCDMAVNVWYSIFCPFFDEDEYRKKRLNSRQGDTHGPGDRPESVLVEQREILAITLGLHFRSRDETERGTVDAISQTAFFAWTVREHMP